MSKRRVKRRVKPTAESLRKLYWTRRLSLLEIAKMLGVTAPTVNRWLRSYHIETRSRMREDILTEEIIEEYFSDKRPSLRELARKFKCSKNTIKRRLIKSGIRIRVNQPSRSWPQITIRKGVSALKGYIICAMFGDYCGCTRVNGKSKYYRIGIYAGEDKDFAKFFAGCMEREYNLKLRIYYHR